MTIEKTELENLIYESVSEVNQMLPQELHLERDLNSILVGEGGVYDSLSIVNFLISLEGKLDDRLNDDVILINEETLSDPFGPNRSLKSLRDHILNIVTSS